MKKITYKGETGYFITNEQKKELDNILKRVQQDFEEQLS